ncbi:hypothetical protein B0T14DRAFT_528314 [Immersiella caudata]|uniref:Ankyrin repeat protein n=1 Tax=Immersiella caudata TaxID=314043 RepID=A0AA40BUQ2_9PEZI|nr:hypothetical protein B0T14DRAFT_528314 [Immersiella caudata]
MQKNTMSLLLEYEANIEAKDKEGRTALCLAAETDFKVGIEMLVAKGAEVNIWYEFRVSSTVGCSQLLGRLLTSWLL